MYSNIYVFRAVTTDVQDTTICQVNITTYIISCVFLNGSDASGCNYTLMSEEGSITGSIERSNSEGETIVVACTAAGSELLLQVYASDLTLDDTTSSLVITQNIARLSLKPCSTGTTGTVLELFRVKNGNNALTSVITTSSTTNQVVLSQEFIPKSTKPAQLPLQN
jgi:hypothetical protein